jgi:hypothetical protein
MSSFVGKLLLSEKLVQKGKRVFEGRASLVLHMSEPVEFF